MRFEIRPLDESEFPLWDEFVDQSPWGTLFHKTFWLKASGRSFIIYGYFKGRELFAGIPLAYNTRFKIKQAFHPPLTPYLGIVFRLKEQNTKYVRRISEGKEISTGIAERLKRDFSFVRFNFLPSSTDLQPFIWKGFSAGIRFTYIINLDNSLEDIWKSMEDKRRGNIRKAEKDSISIASSNDFAQTLNLVEKTFARQGMKADFKSTAFSYNEALSLRNQCKSFFARDKNGDYIAVVYIVWDSKRSYYILGGYDPERSHYGASALAIWEAIKFTRKELGLKEFDLEGSMIPQIEQFFRRFGGEQMPYYTVYWTKPFLRAPIFIYKIIRGFSRPIKTSTEGNVRYSD